VKLLTVAALPTASSKKSTRRLTQDSGTFTRNTAGSHSLERGLQILRAFRAGTSVLTNAELAARTGLPRPTVSRLTRSLVDANFLQYDLTSRAYRLTAVFLSLSDAFQYAEPGLDVALNLIRKMAEGERINVGLAVADQHEMVYLAALRKSQDGISRTRRLVPGSRVPIETTAVGRAYLAALPKIAREKLTKQIAQKYGKKWPAMRSELSQSMDELARLGYCTAVWLPGLLGIGTALRAPDAMVYGVNISFQFDDDDRVMLVNRYAPMLLELAERIRHAWQESAELASE
jgi:DNA-binding IclR family transcriptional regulator